MDEHINTLTDLSIEYAEIKTKMDAIIRFAERYGSVSIDDLELITGFDLDRTSCIPGHEEE